MIHNFHLQQILNITTGTLHTNMDDIYDFFNKVIEDGIMTHMLPRSRKAILPILQTKESFKDLPFESGDYREKLGNYNLSFEFTEDDKKQFWENYKELPSPLEGKRVITVAT